ncbi:hypothetical protein JZ751_026919 [Albula glossodonta]|uniref:Uncharacterized protein n=1 Tax=Albula glossodonta TaxID=121402 RepID=A0A8T2PAZ6_9TELE|nr:hypothetical protein JZ751_026919 [Albula glossodonta]
MWQIEVGQPRTFMIALLNLRPVIFLGLHMFLWGVGWGGCWPCPPPATLHRRPSLEGVAFGFCEENSPKACVPVNCSFLVQGEILQRSHTSSTPA